ncbi:hypothetical protein IEQ34_013378 [Dendrobium chrysotoxum]|uniref:Uncharacterized protein n=1 Tax=Dendrobium chrysotoxum TaxID=161865 RepID=A0AAV7GQU4_DENCH|nr:hypothetical protein IEQ34_013378 [Dendrobium chrysotoxum]
MAAKRMDELERKVKQIKSPMEEKFLTIEARFSTMEGRFTTMESRLGGMEEKMRKLIEMQSKFLPVVPITNPNQYLTGILLAKSKGKEIGLEKFVEESFFHQEPSLRTTED